MAIYLLDTNHASPLITPHHPLRHRVITAIAAGATFAICVPMVTELIFGIGLLPRAVANRAAWAQIQPLFPCYLPDETDAVNAAEMQIALRRQGRQLATVDALIAALALRYDLVLLTTDKDFDAVPELRIENWLR
ncbi:type II toxin-antitoxin system VapC family toxin [Herpetosiphon giganteus]|uniref:type II toxin-antitoxin system VapC family toxin n=1 Tax=Herpetosiphon giganteus TaxID=2029754 RepID=UPI00195B4E38|nr:type II toxin-antitoxin system VapC family toxin [Herpetosiphon giganteus]MBM7842304.1 tRNA(fMet)-specific endonuclease VapC [Herpetosiphon giganteus]